MNTYECPYCGLNSVCECEDFCSCCGEILVKCKCDRMDEDEVIEPTEIDRIRQLDKLNEEPY